MIKKAVYISIITLCLLSCARTVTDRTTTLFVELTLTFRNSIDLNKYTYALVFSESTTTEISYPEPFQDNYMILPGVPYDEDQLDEAQQLTVSQFYDSYFDTWQNVVIFHNTINSKSINLVKSNDTFFDATTTANNTYENPEQLFLYESNAGTSPSQLVLIFDLEQIDPNLSGFQQFQLLVLDSPDDNGSGLLLEAMESDTTFFEVSSGQDSGTQNDAPNSSINGAADLIEWRVRVF